MFDNRIKYRARRFLSCSSSYGVDKNTFFGGVGRADSIWHRQCTHNSGPGLGEEIFRLFLSSSSSCCCCWACKTAKSHEWNLISFMTRSERRKKSEVWTTANFHPHTAESSGEFRCFSAEFMWKILTPSSDSAKNVSQFGSSHFRLDWAVKWSSQFFRGENVRSELDQQSAHREWREKCWAKKKPEKKSVWILERNLKVIWWDYRNEHRICCVWSRAWWFHQVWSIVEDCSSVNLALIFISLLIESPRHPRERNEAQKNSRKNFFASPLSHQESIRIREYSNTQQLFARCCCVWLGWAGCCRQWLRGESRKERKIKHYTVRSCCLCYYLEFRIDDIQYPYKFKYM